MAEFLCKVADANGRVFSQIEAAESMSEARQKLSDRGLFVYQIRPREGLIGQAFGRKGGHQSVDGDRISSFSTSNSTR